MGDRFRMGASYNVEVCALGWIDLLGYGTQIYEAHLNPLSKKAKVALDRLESFNRHAFKALEPIIAGRLRGIRALLVNDGIAVLRDLTPRSSEPTQEFLWLCYQLHLQIRTADEIGARMVVCNGFRVRIQPTATSLNLKHSKAIAILSKMRSAPKEEIVREALQAHGPITSLSELQANFAFTKAYEAERRGKAGGLKGPQLFVEDSFFSDVDKSDFGLKGPSIQVELRKGMNVGFSVLERVPSQPRRSPGVRNAIEIATVLTRDKKIEEKFRNGRIRVGNR